MHNKKILSALRKVLAGDILPFKKPENEKTKKISTLILDWKDADVYPISGSNLKVIGVYLKGVGPDKRFMISIVPTRNNEFSIQLDEVGDDFHRTLKSLPIDEIEKYIKETLVKDLESAYSQIAKVKVIQKISQDLTGKLEILKQSNIKVKANNDEDYRGTHTAPNSSTGAPLWNLKDTYPDDIYTSLGLRYYGEGRPDDVEAIRIIQAARGRRDKQVHIYRSIPKDAPAKINKGDWVAITRTYAKDHGESNLGGKSNYKIVSKIVNARDLFTDGNSIQEWGYDPQPYTPKEQRDASWEKWPGKRKS
jgi:hypothetical protein